MRELLFATRNQGKIFEVAHILQALPYQVISLAETTIPESFDVEETADTFEGNAKLKAQGFGSKAGLLTVADDSGLIVDALGGRPGVYSKRYGKTDEHRIEKLLGELAGVPKSNRSARFVSVVCMFNPQTDQLICKEGSVEGSIGFESKGIHGFGYDPVFIPSEGDGRTFAEYGTAFKNKVSHRARALEKMKQTLTRL